MEATCAIALLLLSCYCKHGYGTKEKKAMEAQIAMWQWRQCGEPKKPYYIATIVVSKCDYGAKEKKPISLMLLHSDGGSVKNKKCYYKRCDGITKGKKITPQAMKAYIFAASIMVVLLCTTMPSPSFSYYSCYTYTPSSSSYYIVVATQYMAMVKLHTNK